MLQENPLLEKEEGEDEAPARPRIVPTMSRLPR
jgi:hypothetical protein